LNTLISQGSVVTRLRCGGIFNNVCLGGYIADCASEMILEMGQYLINLWNLVVYFFVVIQCTLLHRIPKLATPLEISWC